AAEPGEPAGRVPFPHALPVCAADTLHDRGPGAPQARRRAFRGLSLGREDQGRRARADREHADRAGAPGSGRSAAFVVRTGYRKPVTLDLGEVVLKKPSPAADTRCIVDAAERRKILSRYVSHSRRFDEVAAKRGQGNAEVIPFAAPLRELEQEPTAREIEVLQLISEGLVNREIGHRLFLSQATLKTHLRHLFPTL